MASKDRGGLSAREYAAKQAGVAVDYSKSASKQGKSTPSSSAPSTTAVSPRKKGESAREYEARSTGGTLNYNTGAITPGKSAPSSPSKVGSLDDAKSFINANQITDAATGDEVSVRSSVSRYKAIADELGMGEKLSGLDSAMPDAPKYEETYMGLRGDYGVDTLEGKLNDITAQQEALAEQARVNKGANQGKAVAMGVIEGRVSEQEQQARDEMDYLDRQKNTITNELNTKYAVIGEIIKFKGMDYDVAKGQYDTKFSQAVQTFNMVKGIDDSIKTEQERVQDNARANLQIIYNNIANNPDGYKSLDKSTQSMVAKLELQSGLPMGTFTSIASKNPGGEIITTKSWQDAGGKEYISVVTKDKNGALKTSNMLVGQGKVTGTADDKADTYAANENYIFNKLNSAAKGKDGFINPSVWKAALSEWQAAGGKTSDFLATYGGKVNEKGQRISGFINPKDM